MKNIPKSILIVATLFSLSILSCNKDDIEETPFEYTSLDNLYEYNKSKITISQGISGTLLKKEGNCMPMIGGTSTCTISPIEGTIKVFEYTTIEETDGWGPLYDDVLTKLIAQSNSDTDGFFQIKLSPGKYSVFISEKGKYYANSSNGEGGINPIVIQGDSILNQNLRIDYAVY